MIGYAAFRNGVRPAFSNDLEPPKTVTYGLPQDPDSPLGKVRKVAKMDKMGGKVKKGANLDKTGRKVKKVTKTSLGDQKWPKLGKKSKK